MMYTRTSRIAGALLAAAIPLAAGAADTPSAADAVIVAQATTTAPAQGCPGDVGLSPLQRRLLAKYDHDAQSLLSFVWITRNIYLLERGETLLWAESYRQQHPAC
jgi:hypothetical protein